MKFVQIPNYTKCAEVWEMWGEYSEDPHRLTKELDGVSLKGVNMTGRGVDGAWEGSESENKSKTNLWSGTGGESSHSGGINEK